MLDYCALVCYHVSGCISQQSMYQEWYDHEYDHIIPGTYTVLCWEIHPDAGCKRFGCDSTTVHNFYNASIKKTTDVGQIDWTHLQPCSILDSQLGMYLT